MESRICSNRYRIIVQSEIRQLSDPDDQEKVASYDPGERKRCSSLHALYGGFVIQEEWVMVDSMVQKAVYRSG